ncbi:exosortase H-associated membrane protein [Acidovorax sp.]|uniref:exosortase H-associated membrane protein n=1 Tax=Acidovorax sp. TaxID=1872122 RepID=UPI0039189325
MRRPSALTIFVLSAFGWIVVLTLAWSQVSAWTSYPVGVLSHIALEQGAPMWVRQVHLKPGAMEVDTAIEVPVAQAGGQRGEITIEASPGRYAYGLPIFLALLLAARGPGRMVRAVAGYVLLLPFQALSLTMYSLMQMLLAAQLNLRALRISQWQMEAIVYGYQVGALVLPTLVPILLWLWLDRRFVNDVLVRGWRESLATP